MVRRFKRPCLLIMILLALTAITATASGAEFHTESSSATLSGASSSGAAGAINWFGTDSGTIDCSVTATGSKSGATTSSIVLAPSFPQKCKSTGFIEAEVTVDANGCDFNVTDSGSFHLQTCNAGAAGIVITAPFCTITFTSGQTLSPIAFGNHGSGSTREVSVQFGANNLAYHELGFACKNSGKSTTGGTYEGNLYLTATSGGGHTGLWWSA